MFAFATPVFAEGLTEDIQFNVVNNTSATITAFHLSTSRDPSWGDDIAIDYIEPGATMQVDVTDDMPDCEYDARFVFSDGHTVDFGEINRCELNGQTVTVE